MPIVECLGENNKCVITNSCRLADILQGGVKAFLNHLDGFTINDLINKGTHNVLFNMNIPIVAEE